MPPLALLLPETLGAARSLAVAQASTHADSLLRAQARIGRLDLASVFLQTPLHLLHARFQRCQPNHRPNYTPVERRESVELIRRLALGVRAGAARLLVDPATVSRWNHRPVSDLASDDPKPPLPPIEIWVRDLVRSMAVAGFRGYGTIRNHLQHAGLGLSRSSVARFLAEPFGIHETFELNGPGNDTTIPETRLTRLLAARLPRNLDPVLHAAIELATTTFDEGITQHVAALRERQYNDPEFDPHTLLASDAEQREHRLGLLAREFLLLHSRFARLDPARRPHFRPEQRFEILEHQRRFRLPCHFTARLFLLARGTLSTWRAEADGRGADETHLLHCHDCSEADIADKAQKELVSAGARITDAAALVRELIGRLAPLVTDIKADPSPAAEAAGDTNSPDTTPEAAPRKRSKTRIRADYANHVWLLDIFQVPCLAGVPAFVGLAQDAFSRLGLRAKVLRDEEPTADDLATLLDETVARHGKPKHTISDQGKQLVSEEFKRCLKRHGAKHRYGAVGKHGSIAIIERLILTIKLALQLFVKLDIQPKDVQPKLDLVVHWYNQFRPHTTLGCATPLERYRALASPADSALPAPRRPRDGTHGHGPPRIRIAHIDPEGLRLPYLVRVD
jgi:transposase InsO family protein